LAFRVDQGRCRRAEEHVEPAGRLTGFGVEDVPAAEENAAVCNGEVRSPELDDIPKVAERLHPFVVHHQPEQAERVAIGTESCGAGEGKEIHCSFADSLG